MSFTTPNTNLPWLQTPLIPSPHLSRSAGCNIYLKLENLQPSGSFKSRGIGNLIRRATDERGSHCHFYSSSGGNAGLACATSAHAFHLPATIVTPTTTSPLLISKLRLLGARVEQIGENWAIADRHLRDNLLALDPQGVYVPPFDHPHIWDGAATIVDELVTQVPPEVEIHGIVCSVGGGGMINGLFQGVAHHEQNRMNTTPWPAGHVPSILAVETRGADSLNASIEAGKHITLPGISSIAKSLGAVRVSSRTWEWAQCKARIGISNDGGSDVSAPAELESVTVSDPEAAMATVQFADDTRLMVEAACGATISTCYNGLLRQKLGKGLSDDDWRSRNVVVIVCGGSDVSLEVLDGYRRQYKST